MVEFSTIEQPKEQIYLKEQALKKLPHERHYNLIVATPGHFGLSKTSTEKDFLALLKDISKKENGFKILSPSQLSQLMEAFKRYLDKKDIV